MMENILFIVTLVPGIATEYSLIKQKRLTVVFLFFAILNIFLQHKYNYFCSVHI